MPNLEDYQNQTSSEENTPDIPGAGNEHDSSNETSSLFQRMAEILYIENARFYDILCRCVRLNSQERYQSSNENMGPNEAREIEEAQAAAARRGSMVNTSWYCCLGGGCITFAIMFKSVPCCLISCSTLGSFSIMGGVGQNVFVESVARRRDRPIIPEQDGDPATAQQLLSTLIETMESLPEENGHSVAQEQAQQLISTLIENMESLPGEDSPITPEQAQQLMSQMSGTLESLTEQQQQRLPMGLQPAQRLMSQLSEKIESIPGTYKISNHRATNTTPQNGENNSSDRQSMHSRATRTPAALFSDPARTEPTATETSHEVGTENSVTQGPLVASQ